MAVAAALNVTEPTSTGIGGDLFCLFYSAADKTIRGLNASGRAPAALTLERVRADLGLSGDGAAGPHADEAGVQRIPMDHVHAVTVPGAAAGWCDAVALFGSGRFQLKHLLADATRLADDGYPVSELSAMFWALGEKQLRDASPNYAEMLRKGERPPRVGEIMAMPTLAQTFRELAEKGKPGFYEGRVAEALVEAVQARGGVMELSDLKDHMQRGSQEVAPIGIEFAGSKVWETAPNGQGIVCLMALGILEALEKRGVIGELGKGEYAVNSAEYLHAVIEALRIAFADGHWWVTDPDVEQVPVPGMLSKNYLEERSKLFSKEKANDTIHHGTPAFSSSDTVYFSVTDAAGNGCSFINSNYGGFGAAIIPRGCGFTLQNRGSGFSLRADHPNVLKPGKRPYHTIIPAMLTNPAGTELEAVFGVMGGFMQPQGHTQVVLNMLKSGMDPQRALDSPRVSVGNNYDPGALAVSLEDGIPPEVVDKLKAKGHNVKFVEGHYRGMFGRGQIIRVSTNDGKKVFSAGSDMRGDGHAVGY